MDLGEKRKINETIIIRNSKLTYAVKLKDDAKEGNAPYILVERGEIVFVEGGGFYRQNEFDFSNEIHAIAKQVFVDAVQTAIKQRILELKQLQLVFDDINLSEAIGMSIIDNQGILAKATTTVKKLISGIGN